VLLKAGADVSGEDDVGSTAIVRAADQGHTAIVQMLLEAGADGNHTNRDGKTPLMAAANKGHTAIVQALLEIGADVHHVDKSGVTALMGCALNGHTETVQVLLKAGIDVHHQDEGGRTAPLFAAINGHTDIMQALLDAGVDIDHEDLRQNIWVNEDEIPNNGKDDDNNGYIDDIHGWNFLGGANFTRFEYVRLLATGNTNHPKYAEAKSEYDGQVKKYTDLKSQYLKLLNDIDTSDKAISKYLNKKEYTLQDINGIKTQNKSLQEHIDNIKMAFSFGHETIANLKAALQRDINGFSDRLEYHLNLNFDGRKLVGDNPNDINDTNYGNNNIKPITQERSHGTHVSGIVAAKRNNGIGINGVANNVKIMAIRNTPNGDEYDKDVALAIRYAVNNGAKVINMSLLKVLQWLHQR